MPAILNSSFRLTSTAKRTLFVIPTLLLLYLLVQSRNSRSWWDSYGGSRTRPKIQHAYADGLDTYLNVSQWGERGVRVRQLAQWADLLIEESRGGQTVV